MNLRSQSGAPGSSTNKQVNKLEKFASVQRVLRELECPICWEVPLPFTQIATCKRGHFICGDCKSKLGQPARCFCNGTYSDSRNFFLENLLLHSLYSCSYVEDGCQELLEGTSLDQHSSTCNYRPLTCNNKTNLPCNGALVRTSQYLNHLKERHHIQGQIQTVENGNTFRLNMDPESEYIQVSYIVCDEKEFLIHSLFANTMIYFWVTLLDNTNQHLKNYQVHLFFNRGDISLKYNYPLPVYSPRTDFHAEMPAMCCAVLPVLSLRSVFFVKQRDSHILPFYCTVEKKNNTYTADAESLNR